MSRVTKADLESAIHRLYNRTGQRFELDYLQGKPRLSHNNRFISPRLKSSEMLMWIDAFEEGIAWSGADRMRRALNSAPALPENHLNEATPRMAVELQQWGATYYEWYNNDRQNAYRINGTD